VNRVAVLGNAVATLWLDRVPETGLVDGRAPTSMTAFSGDRGSKRLGRQLPQSIVRAVRIIFPPPCLSLEIGVLDGQKPMCVLALLA
jgi:hypothetical protein